MSEVPTLPRLPLKRCDCGIEAILRLGVPDLEKFKTWTPQKAKRVK